MSLYFRVRERIRLNPFVAKGIYLVQSVRYSFSGEFRKSVVALSRKTQAGSGVALCCRIREEAPNLQEFVEYHLAAGIDHIFFYEKLSRNDFRSVLDPYILRGVVTLLADWQTYPVSPAAEQDCILRAIGKYAWVGMIDADEFVVIRDGRSIGNFLAGFSGYPGVALHWRMFGSNGHKTRPEQSVTEAYTRRELHPNRHVKCFVRPEAVARCRNSHSWYYQRLAVAVNEKRRPVLGSISLPPTAETAWINHYYHHKSHQEYFAKAARQSVLDQVGIKF